MWFADAFHLPEGGWPFLLTPRGYPVFTHDTGRNSLALFFQVSPSYFFEEELTEFPETEVRLLAAARRETLRRLVVTLLGLSDDSLNAVLNLACRMRRLEGLPAPD